MNTSPPGPLARLASQLDGARIDLLELVLEEGAGELSAVRAEAVRLDQLGARIDEADVERDDGLGCAQVRLLRRAQPRNGRAQQGAHAAVRNDRRTLLQTIYEISGHTRRLEQVAARPTGACVKKVK